MSRMNRRDFLRLGAAGAAVAGWGPVAWAETPTEAGARSAATRLATLGRTGIQCSYVGMGTGTNGWAKNSDQQRQGEDYFHRLLIEGYERGVTYFDLADQYGSHDNMHRALKDGGMDRSKLMLLTKTTSREPAEVKADLERFRKELDTDYLDVVLLHCLTEGGWTEKHRGAMDVLAEAKEQGLIRAHGVSCHNLDAMKEAAKSPWCEVMLSRINPFGLRMDGTVEEVVTVLKEAHATGMGIIGMKIAGGAKMDGDKLTESLKFVTGLDCIHAMTIGFVRREEMDDAFARLDGVMAA